MTATALISNHPLSGEAPARKPEPRSYFPELDSLRFFAFAGVFLAHTFYLREADFTFEHLPRTLGKFIAVVPDIGRPSVDVFFVLSSFLITGLLLRERKLTGDISVRKFYLRRVLKLWPIYFLVIGLTLLISRVDPVEKLDWPHALAFIIFSGNWALTLYPVQTLAMPLWTVAAQEQFYIFWPWVVRLGQRATVVGITLVWLASFAFRCYLAAHAPYFYNEMNTFNHLISVAYGAALAVFLRGAAPALSLWVRYLSLIAGCSLIYFGTYFGAPAVKEGVPIGALLYLSLAEVGGVMLLIGVIGIQDRIVGPFLRSRPLVYLGRISYGLYAYQGIAFWLIGSKSQPKLHALLDHRHHGRLWFQLGWLIVALTFNILIAVVSFELFERRILRLKEKFATVKSRPGG